MTGPTPLRELARQYLDEALASAASSSTAKLSAAYVLATMDLADAVRATVPRATFVNTEFTGTMLPRVGDKDPTPFSSVSGYRGACKARDASDYLCTLDPAHRGPHVAGDGDEVCAVWNR